MPKYRLIVTAKAHVTGSIEVEAEDAWAAKQLVLEGEVDPPTEWEIGDEPDVMSCRAEEL